MADENLNPQNENIQEGDARRTLKLRPSTTTPAGSQLADPMHGETDTSNLDVLDDTQTRKTIKIKPLTPTAPQINIGALPQSPGATPLSGTQTRKTVVLKPQAVAGATPLSGTQTRKAVVISPAATPGATPLSGTQTRKAVVISPAAAQGATPLSGTQTRKTVVLKPAAKPTFAVPETAAAPAPAAAPANEMDDTVTRKATVIAPVTPAPAAPASDMDDTVTRKATVIAVPETEDDKTVKITRPKLNKPAIDPKRTVKLDTVAPAVTAPAPVPAPAAAPAPAAPVAAPAPAPAPAPVAAPAPVEEEKVEEPVVPEAPVLSAADIPEPPKNLGDMADLAIEPKAEEAQKPSIFYTVVAAITLLMVIAASAFAVAQYLDYNHKVDIYSYIPGLPHANK